MAGEPASAPLGRIANAFGLVLLLVLSTYVTASLMRYSGWNAVAIVALGTVSGVLAFAASGARVATAPGGDRLRGRVCRPRRRLARSATSTAFSPPPR